MIQCRFCEAQGLEGEMLPYIFGSEDIRTTEKYACQKCFIERTLEVVAGTRIELDVLFGILSKTARKLGVDE